MQHITPDLLNQIINCFEELELTEKETSKEVNLSRYIIFSIKQELYFLNKHLSKNEIIHQITHKTCVHCKKEVNLLYFNLNPFISKFEYISICQFCQENLTKEVIENEGRYRSFEKIEISENKWKELENNKYKLYVSYLQQVLNLYNSGIGMAGMRKILRSGSKHYNQAFELLNLVKFPFLRKVLFKTENWCSFHQRIEPIENFRIHKAKNERRFYNCMCIEASNAKSAEISRKSYAENPEIWKKYKENGRERDNANIRRREKEDIHFKLKRRISCEIKRALKNNGSSKKGHSMLEFLPNTIEEIKCHLESLFEPWMTWNNHGSYKRKEWDDNNKSTWKWQIDHIIPQSDLPFTSMEEENFKKCWTLSNLRPLNAKQNVIDGSSKIRHKKKDEK